MMSISTPVAASPAAAAKGETRSAREEAGSGFSDLLASATRGAKGKSADDEAMPQTERDPAASVEPFADWPRRLELLIADGRLADGGKAEGAGEPAEAAAEIPVEPQSAGAGQLPAVDVEAGAEARQALMPEGSAIGNEGEPARSSDPARTALAGTGAELAARPAAAAGAGGRPAGEQQPARRALADAAPRIPAPAVNSAGSDASPIPATTDAPGEAEAIDIETRQPRPMLRNEPQAASDRSPLLPAGASVLSSATAPAPAPSSAPAALVAASIETDRVLTAAARDIAEGRQPERTQPLQVLRIQLQPAELGSVTARLSVIGTEMTVELQVETAEARQKLQADSDQIVKALRGLGFEVERIMVQHQVSPAGSSQQAADGRGFEGREPGAQADEGGRRGESNQNQGSQGRNASPSAFARDDADRGSGVFI